MKVDITISDLTLEEFTCLCSRLGEISIDELLKEESKKEIKTLITKENLTETEAKEKQAKTLEKKIDKAIEDGEDTLTKLSRLATEKFVNKNRIPELVTILKDYGVKSIPELDSALHKEVYERLKNV